MGAFSIIGALFHIGALALLLLATLTSPVTQSLYLATDGDYQFGVFGYCNTARGTCSKAAASYLVSSLSKKTNYVFDDDKRNNLQKILIVFPVACGLTFFSFIMALINVKRTRLILLSIISIILATLSFVGSALACIMTFLVFYPNIKWCSWVQIASAVLNLIALVFIIIDMKLSGSTDDLTSMDGGEVNEYSLKNNLISDDVDSNYKNDTSFAIPPRSNFNNLNMKSPLTRVSSDVSSMTERKSITDITVQQNRFLSSNSALTNPSQQHQEDELSIYAGPLGSSIRNQAPVVVPEIAETQREPTIPLIGDPYMSTQESLPNNLNVEDDRHILRADTLEFNDPHLDDNHSFEAGSDFTSVSQRAINPKYYRGANNLPSQNFQPRAPPQQNIYNGVPPPLQQQQQQQQFAIPNQQPQRFGPQPQQFAPAPQNYMMQPNPYSMPSHQQQYQPHPQQQQPQQFYPRHGRRSSKPNASDVILQNNPNFMVGKGAARQQMTRYGQTAPPPPQGARTGQNYKNRSARNLLPPASMAKDGPYGSFV